MQVSIYPLKIIFLGGQLNMKLSKTILFITLPIAFIIAIASMILVCSSSLYTLTGVLCFIAGAIVFSISIGYIVWSCITLDEMKDKKNSNSSYFSHRFCFDINSKH